MDTWIERVEDLVNMLEGSSISELELTEAGTKIIIRRQPGMMASAPVLSSSTAQVGVPVTPGVAAPTAREDTGVFPGGGSSHARRDRHSYLGCAAREDRRRSHHAWLPADDDLCTRFGQFQFANAASFEHVNQVFNALNPCIHFSFSLFVSLKDKAGIMTAKAH